MYTRHENKVRQFTRLSRGKGEFFLDIIHPEDYIYRCAYILKYLCQEFFMEKIIKAAINKKK